MQHVRLRLTYMCPALFGKELPGTMDMPDFELISLPNVQTLLVNCDTNGMRHEYPYFFFFSELGDEAYMRSSWFSVAPAQHGASLPPNAKIHVCDAVWYKEVAKRQYSTLFCADMRSETTMAYPCRQAAYETKDCMMLRTQDEELFSSHDDFTAFVEGETWKSMPGGARLPAALLGTSLARNCAPKQLQIRSSEDWRREHSEWQSQLWDNELLLGYRILEAEKRQGPDEFLSREVIVDKIPPGFVRPMRGFREIYCQDEGYESVWSTPSPVLSSSSTNEVPYRIRPPPNADGEKLIHVSPCLRTS